MGSEQYTGCGSGQQGDVETITVEIGRVSRRKTYTCVRCAEREKLTHSLKMQDLREVQDLRKVQDLYCHNV